MQLIQKLFLIITLSIISISVLQAGNKVDIIYTSPVDGGKYLRPEETIIISANKFINENTLIIPGVIEVSGKRQNLYHGDFFLSSDNKTILFRPESVFLHSDTITVQINPGITTLDGEGLIPKSFSFIIRDSLGNTHFDSFGSEFGTNLNPRYLHYNIPYNNFADQQLPNKFPELFITSNTTTSSNKLFISNFTLANFNGDPNSHDPGSENRPSGEDPNPYLIIYDTDSVFFYKQMERYALDFKRTIFGDLVYYSAATWEYLMMDSNYLMKDTITCGNGYPTDGHELLFLENGHMLLMSYDPVSLDMSAIVPGGQQSANVIGLVIQELDKEKNVVFQWRSWDHFEITDAPHENLTLLNIDYVHGNSIEPDLDGNLLISSRHLNEITKINRTTGDIIWRMGGINNEFTFLNDSRGFTYQHDARRVAPGRITLFDNGNFHTPPYSRAVEYEVDEVNKTVELVWEYDHNKEIYAFAMGNAQRLPNGNTLIGWGTGSPNVTEVDPNGNIVFEMAIEDTSWTYRALRYDFRQPGNVIPEKFHLSQNYPNPFNPATNISFDVTSASNVVLEIYDVLGRKVDELVNQNLAAGNYNMLWNAENLSSGVYFYSLRAGSFTDTKKMVLLK